MWNICEIVYLFFYPFLSRLSCRQSARQWTQLCRVQQQTLLNLPQWTSRSDCGKHILQLPCLTNTQVSHTTSLTSGYHMIKLTKLKCHCCLLQSTISTGLENLIEEPTLSCSCMMSSSMKRQNKTSYRYEHYFLRWPFLSSGSFCMYLTFWILLSEIALRKLFLFPRKARPVKYCLKRRIK